MKALDVIRTAAGMAHSIDHPHHASRVSLTCEPLEPRQLLSAVPAATATETESPQAIGATGGLGGTSGFVGTAGTGSTVQTQGTGGVNFLQSQVPVGDLLSNLSQVPTAVAESPGPLSVASGLLSLPITPLIQPIVSENETPLNNGTPITGTVWITPPPVPPGMFHISTTESPALSHVYIQTVNPQGGPPTFTHFGQSSTGSLNGVTVEEPVAVGPVGPSMTDEIEPAQPPPVEAHQPVGPPVQVQQDETTPQQDATTLPGGEQGAGQPGMPGQGSAPGEHGATTGPGQHGSAGGSTTPGAETGTPNAPAGQGSQGGAGAQGPTGGAQGGASGGSGGSSGWAAFLERTRPDMPGVDHDAAIELIDAAIPGLASYSDPDGFDDRDGGLSTLFGAAVVAAGGYRLALRRSDRRNGLLVLGPPDSGPADE